MSILTYDTAVSGEIAPKPAKGFWTRAFDRLLEARRQQAERILRQHLALHDLNAARHQAQRGFAAVHRLTLPSRECVSSAGSGNEVRQR
jgi:hypothetical protein